MKKQARKLPRISKELQMLSDPMFRHKVEDAKRGRQSYNRKRYRIDDDMC